MASANPDTHPSPHTGALWRPRVPSHELRYLIASFLNGVSGGLLVTIQVVFVTQKLKIAPVHLGVALTCGAVLGMVAGVALGKWSDGRNLRRLMPAFGVAQAVAAAGYLVSTSPLVLGVVVGAMSVAGRGSAAVRGPFMAGIVGPDNLVTYRAKVRSVANAAMAVGAALGGIALGSTAPAATTVAMASVPAGCLLGAALTASVHLPYANDLQRGTGDEPAKAPAPAPTSTSLPAVKNPRFLAVTALSAVLVAHVPMLSVAFPLWISQRTSAPSSLISVVVLVNTVGVVLIQVPMSTLVRSPQDAARACFRAGLALACAVVLLVSSSNLVGTAQIAVIVLAALLHLVGEALHSAASWELAFTLAPRDRLGEYQGTFNSGADLSMMLGPAVFSVLVSAPNPIGWWVLAATQVLAGTLMTPAVRQAVPDMTESR